MPFEVPTLFWIDKKWRKLNIELFYTISSLQLRHKISRLQALFKIIHQDYSLSIPPHFISMTRSTRLYHPHRFILPNSSTYSYQQNFFSRSIKDWNNLPSSTIESINIDFFQRNCKHCIELNNCNLCNYVAKFIL